MSSYRLYAQFIKGIWKQNPALVLLLGMCPTLAITNSAINGLSMGGSFSHPGNTNRNNEYPFKEVLQNKALGRQGEEYQIVNAE